VLFNAEVTDIDCDACVITLRSGETHTGDVIIGADGASGAVRKCLMKENLVARDEVLTGLAVYRYVCLPSWRSFQKMADQI
jgi:2-polyprenyl-6-methoxyphenol hydroxylase-like FAD-dependent oxidoreductase